MNKLRRFAGCAAGLAGILLFTVVLGGCSRPVGTPLEQAQRALAHGNYADAIRLLDETLASASDPELRAELLALKGRCYWEQSDGMAEGDTLRLTLENAATQLTASIQAHDSGEARHLRSKVYQQLGDTVRADEDLLAWRELDPTFKRAYMNEKPDDSVRDRSRHEQEPTEEEVVEDAAPWRPRAQEDLDGTEDDPLAATLTPGRRAGSDSSGQEDDSRGVGSSRAAADSSPSTGHSGRGTRPTAQTPAAAADVTGRHARSREQAGTRGVPGAAAAENVAATPPTGPRDAGSQGDNPAAEGPAANDTAAADPELEDDAAQEDAAPPPTRPRLPGSTWQPWTSDLAAPGEYGGLPSGPRADNMTTGVTGPVGPPNTSSGDDPAARWQTAGPTTGLPSTGSSATGITGPVAPYGVVEASPSGMPSTGITGPTAGAALPSGVPGPAGMNLPRVDGPALPYTGALPQAMQPRASAAANLAVSGPVYSPLVRSPLTDPNHPVNRGGLPLGSLPPRPTPPRPPASAGASPGGNAGVTAPVALPISGTNRNLPPLPSGNLPPR